MYYIECGSLSSNCQLICTVHTRALCMKSLRRQFGLKLHERTKHGWHCEIWACCVQKSMTKIDNDMVLVHANSLHAQGSNACNVSQFSDHNGCECCNRSWLNSAAYKASAYLVTFTSNLFLVKYLHSTCATYALVLISLISSFLGPLSVTVRNANLLARWFIQTSNIVIFIIQFKQKWNNH